MGGYRADIDGLRAIAVLAVVAFHAFPWLAPGGFVGVDIFFVISGFLITSIILTEMERGEFSVAGFYERRVRRILPALIAVVTVTTVVAFILFMPRNLISFAKTVVATMFFASNYHFATGEDYFAVARELKPLLHTWSLAVEEQFYILFPLLLLILVPRGRVQLLAGLATIVALSFVANVILSHTEPTIAFYWAPLRAWELLAGALLASGVVPLLQNRSSREFTAFLGLLAIGWSIVALSEETIFPGWAAIAPVLGAAAIIHAGSEQPTAASRLLSLPLFVFFGLISYSLYLWHWPLLTFGEYYLMRAVAPVEASVLILLGIILASMTWRFVERPWRRRNAFLERPGLFRAAGALSIGLAAIAWTATQTGGYPGRFSTAVVAATYELNSERKRMRRCSGVIPGNPAQVSPCRFGDAAGAKARFVVWGDSHAIALLPVLAGMAGEYHYAGASAAKLACSALQKSGRAGARHGCPEFNQRALGFIRREKPDFVVLTGRWPDRSDRPESAKAERLKKAILFRINQLKGLGIGTVVIGPVPEPGFNVTSVYGRAKAWGRDTPEYIPTSRFLKRKGYVLDALRMLETEGAALVAYPHEAFCDRERCDIVRSGQVLFVDDNHLSAAGTNLLRGTLAPVFKGQWRR